MKTEVLEKKTKNSEPKKSGFLTAIKNAWGRLTAFPFVKEYGYLLLCMLIPAVLIYLIYLARGEHPFGDGSVLVLDLNGQYVWFFEALRNFVRGDADLLYSFARQLGGEFMGIYAYYLASPLSFFLSLFPKNRMLEALLALFMLKGALCGASFGIYMHKTSKKPNKIAIVIFSASYALCSYAIIQQHNTMWIDAVMWLPLITLGIENLIKHGKFKLYVVALAIAVYSNFYIGYMLCFYCIIYFFIYYFGSSAKFRNNPMREKFHFFRSLGRFAGYSALALGIAAVIILGAYYSLNFGKTTFTDPSWEFQWKFDLMDFFYKLLPASYDTVRYEGLPFVYCGVLTILLVPAYFASKKYTVREKIFSALFLLIFFFSFSINVVDLVWHGFQKPQWLNYRYSFMFSFYLCVLACRVMTDLDRASIRFARVFDISAIILIAGYGITERYGETKTFSNIFIYFSLIAVFVYLLVLTIIRRSKQKQTASFALACIVIVELFLNGLLGINGLFGDVGYSPYSRYNNFLKEVRPIVETVQEKDDSFYRMEKTFYRSNNDNMALNIRGLSGSTSTLNKETIRFLNSMGYASKAHWTKFLGNTPVADSLLGIKYLITDQAIYDTYYDVFATDENGKYTAYLNPYALSIAYGVSDDLLDFELGFVEETKTTPTDEKEDGQLIKDSISSIKGIINSWLNIEENNASKYVDAYTNPFERMNAIIGAMLGEEEPVAVFVPIETTVSKTENVTEKTGYADQRIIGYIGTGSGTSSITLQTDIIPQDAEIFFYYPSMGYAREVSLSLSVSSGAAVSKGTFNGNDTARIISLGTQKENDTLSLKMTLKSKDLYGQKDADCFWYIDMEAFQDAMSRLGQNQLQIKEYTEHSFEGTYTASRANEFVLTTLAYDNGWEIWVDGERVEITKALGALVAFNVGGEAGETHEIRMVYNPKTLNIGLVVSIVSILVFIALIVLDRRFDLGCKRRDDVDYNDGRGESEEDEESTNVAILDQEPDTWDKMMSTSRVVIEKLKVIFIPPKREKYVHQHSKKKKKK